MTQKFFKWTFEDEIEKLKPMAQQIVVGAKTNEEKAIRIFNYVRDEIKFGFTEEFDQASPSYTLQTKQGHCNPQASPFKTLMNAVGIPTRLRLIPVYLDPLVFFWPNHLFQSRTSKWFTGTHTYCEVQLNNNWIPVDGYIVDKPLVTAARKDLIKKNATIGNYIHVDAKSDWDGKSKCMSQYVDDSIKLQNGFDIAVDSTEELEQFYQSERYEQRDVAFSRGAKWFFSHTFLPLVNYRIKRLRKEAGLESENK
jgi:transglutaminase-like putative cysteine protease